MSKSFAVIGLGSFGGSIVRELVAQGMDVLAIDIKEERVNEYASIATHAVIGDTTDEKVLKSLGIGNFDHVIVAIGNDIQASILTTIILKELGVKNVVAKSLSEYHEKVLLKIGADRVVHPERDMGKRLALKWVYDNVLDYLELSYRHSIVEIVARKPLAGNSIVDLNIRARYGITIVAIKRENDLIVSPKAEEMILENDVLIVIGADDDIARFEKKMISLAGRKGTEN